MSVFVTVMVGGIAVLVMEHVALCPKVRVIWLTLCDPPTQVQALAEYPDGPVSESV